MQLESFGVFYDLAQTRSVSATARHFSLTRKGTRRQLALLERELQTELTECHRQKIRLTLEGRLCSHYGAQMVATLRWLEAAIQQARELAANEFHLDEAAKTIGQFWKRKNAQPNGLNIKNCCMIQPNPE